MKNNLNNLNDADLVICLAALQDKLFSLSEKIDAETDTEKKEKLMKSKKVYQATYDKIK